MHSQIEFSKDKKIILVLMSINKTENCIDSASYYRYLLMHRKNKQSLVKLALKSMHTSNKIFAVLLINTNGLQCRYLDKMSIFSLISNFQN